MRKYVVTIHDRDAGIHGAFRTTALTVEAETFAEARRIAGDQRAALGQYMIEVLSTVELSEGE